MSIVTSLKTVVFKFGRIATIYAISLVAANSCIASSADAEGPIYLQLNPDSTVSTFDYVAAQKLDGTLQHRFAERKVTQAEIDSLKSAGHSVAFFSPTDTTHHGAGTSIHQNASTASLSQLTSLPTSFTILQYNGVIYGNFYVPGTQPPGTSTQWVGWILVSTNYPQTSHFVSCALLDSSIVTTSVDANCVATGGIGIPGGCGQSGVPTYSSQLETAYPGGNHLYFDSCYPSGVTNGGSGYNILLSAATSSWMSYWIKNVSTGVKWNSPAEYSNSDRPSAYQISPATAHAGLLMAAVFATPTDWTLNFSGAATGWY